MTAEVESQRFEILRRLGEGGMGEVYEAIDRERGSRVALKMLHETGDELLTWLKREFRAAQDLQHPNLVGLHELLSEGGRWFITMELVRGTDFLSYVWRTDAGADPGSNVRTVERADTVPASSELLDVTTRRNATSSDRTERVPSATTDPSGRDARAPASAPANAPRPSVDEARLRAALRQLCEGLLAIHAAGMVHRDIKPSNVLVTPDGRLVVLDFGLVAEARANASGVAGTPTYMAPEQAAGLAVGPEADWYAVGVMLYEALTGEAPFDAADGSVAGVMLRKQTEEPAPLGSFGLPIPQDLEDLCHALLRPDPADRPSGAAVFERLTGTPRESRRDPLPSTAPPFVGRSAELAALDDAFAASRRGLACVLVEGESGLGKSRLVRRFIEGLAARRLGPLVLASRCYERESVPYKAFDGFLDAVVETLRRATPAEVRELAPTHPGALLQLFPVLKGVPAFASAAHGQPSSADPLEQRTRAFAGVRELFVRLSEVQPLVLVIDDMQWADHDSLALLAEVTRMPGGPRMLLVFTVRTAGDAPGAAANARTKAEIAGAVSTGVRELSLAPLGPDDARSLAAQLAGSLGGAFADAGRLDAIAREAGGHPLFIDVLTRRAAPSSRADDAPRRLEDVLTADLAELSPDARAIAEIVSLARTPLRQRVVEHAAGVAADVFVSTVRSLRAAHVVVTSGARISDFIEPYHDRVRSVLFASVSAERRAELHRRRALAREATGDDDPEALALHWREAGEPERAAREYVRAGDRAAQGLAFDHAATLYAEAIACGERASTSGPATRAAFPPDLRRALLVKLGDALANAGRGKRAADVLRAATDGALAAERLELRRRAAEQLLRSGHFDEGVALLDEVLHAVGVRLPRTPLGAVVYFVFLRLALVIRGLRYRERDISQLSAEALVRADVCWSAAFGLSLSDTVRGAALQARTLLTAVRLGEGSRVARALSLEGAYVAQRGAPSWSACKALIARAADTAERSGSAYARAFQVGSAGAAHYLNGDYREARALCERADFLLREHCVGAAWELDSVNFFGLMSLAQLGQLRELVKHSSTYLREATDRGDLYATVNLRLGYGNLRWLVADDAEAARRNIDAAVREWSKRGFHLEHCYELIARANLELYAGTPRAALAFIASRWAAYRRSLIPLRVQSMRIYGWNLRARVALACAAQATGTSDAARLLRAARQDARRMASERVPWAVPLVRLLDAGVLRVAGRETARVATLLEAASVEFERAGMEMHHAVARWALGSLDGSDAGRGSMQKSEAWFREQGVVRPERFVAMLAPGLTDEK